MRLQTQLTIAFTSLLIVVMAIAGITIYSQMLQMLIKDEQRQLEDKGELIVNFLLSQDLNITINMQRLLNMLEEYNVHIFAYDEGEEQIIFTSIPDLETLYKWVEYYDLRSEEQPLWEAKGEKYVVSILPFYTPVTSQQLVLLTPLDDLQAVQRSLVNRLILIFLIGIIAAVLVSNYLTKTLVTPLTKLRKQLKKVEKREFDEMEEIKATGEIKEVAQSVDEMANELKSYIQSQRHFFQNASHELKTPLMTIQGYAEGIRDGIFEGKDAERGYEVMVEEINRLKKIINEIILLAKLDSEAEPYHVEEVSLEWMTEQIKDRSLPLASEKGIEFQVNQVDDVILTIDPEKFLRAMMNIVTNSIRHAHSLVHISVESDSASIKIVIQDDGDGIPPEMLEQLFHRFVKGKTGETGLGLAIARAIVEKSGGRIKAENIEPHGARFTITFPQRKREVNSMNRKITK